MTTLHTEDEGVSCGISEGYGVGLRIVHVEEEWEGFWTSEEEWEGFWMSQEEWEGF